MRVTITAITDKHCLIALLDKRAITVRSMAALSPLGRGHLSGAAISDGPAEGRFICAQAPLGKTKNEQENGKDKTTKNSITIPSL